MTRIKVYSFLFLTLFIGISFTSIADANDAAIKALLAEIASLESNLDSLLETEFKKEADLNEARQSLSNISQNIDNADRYIVSTKMAYDAAESNWNVPRTGY
jgi:DNA repair exonuclease SbcCD ATPase subunit